MTPAEPTPDAASWARLSPLLDEALDLPLPERAAWLAALQLSAPQDAAQLRVLLDRHEAASRDDFLAGSAQSAVAGPAAGLRLGPWTIEAPLGEGGMASVWLARRSDGRHDGQAAIKLMHGRLHGTQATQRFEREGRILARLEHPHIARLLDAGVAIDGRLGQSGNNRLSGQPYLVLELVRGQPIDRWCDERRLSVDARLALFADVLAAVAHAHTHGAIHRDLKPANILVDDSGSVKLLDFGIAKLLDDEAAAGDSSAPSAITQAITREGGRALTPEYASPEQLRGEGVTTATDVYALGVLLYQLLSGRHPTAQVGGSAAELMRSTLNTDPPRLSRAAALAAEDHHSRPASAAAGDAAALRSTTAPRLRRALEGDLDNILARALRKAPAERYATVVAFADDLRRHRQHEPVHARPDTLAYRGAKFLRRHRGAVAAGALVSLAVVAGLVGTVWQAQRAELERAAALDQLGRAVATSELLTFLVAAATDKTLNAGELLARAEALVEQEYPATPAIRAHVQILLSGLWSNLGDLPRMQSLIDRAQVSAVESGDAALITQAGCSSGLTDVAKGEFKRARAHYDTLIASARQRPEEQQLAMLECLLQRAFISGEEGKPDAVLQDVDEALRLIGPNRREHWQTQASLRNLRAHAFSSRGQLTLAISEYERLQQDLARLGRDGLITNIVPLNDFGTVLMRAGQVGRAVTASGAAMAIALRASDRDQVELATEMNHGRALFESGRHAEALPILQHVLGRAERAGPRMLGNVGLYVASALCRSGQAASCTALIQRSEQALTEFLPPGHGLFAQVAVVKAQAALARSDPAAAVAHAESAVAIATKAKRSPGDALMVLARAELRMGQGRAALQHVGEALAVYRTALADFPASWQVGQALLLQGEVLHVLGEDTAARASLTEARTQLEAAVGPGTAQAAEAARLLAKL